MAALVKWVFEIELDYRWNVAAHLDPDFKQRFPEGCASVDRGGVRRLEIRPDGSASVLRLLGGLARRFTRWKRSYKCRRVPL